MASRGLRENEQFKAETVTDTAIADASRHVARTIYRDSALIGLVAAVVGALTALIG